MDEFTRHYLGISEGLFLFLFVIVVVICAYISGHYKIKRAKKKEKEDELNDAKAWVQYQRDKVNAMVNNPNANTKTKSDK